MNLDTVLADLKSMGNPEVRAGLARFGVNAEHALGLEMPKIRMLAKTIGRDHALALGLWGSGIHEARILAGLVDDPRAVTEEQMEAWVAQFDAWDVCDQVCGSLFDKTPFALAKAAAWSARNEEYVKRAGFALMASLAVHDRQAKDEAFLAFLPMIEREAVDDRNFVKKAVNWALRQIGKRNIKLNASAVACAKRIAACDERSARWIASDALKELTDAKIVERVAAKAVPGHRKGHPS
ncbi:MAG: DNA alkylation repair protein [Deltaproteobacteria bacterium]|nr:DNA alkylation repair protein [Deltaproteobacteria bacterium]